MMERTIWLARHGNRQDFVDPAWTQTAERPYDPGLSPDGIEQARLLGLRLRGEGIGGVFASPFLRTVETAHCVAAALDLPIFLEPGIAEWLNPAWFSAQPALLPPAALHERFPQIDLSYASPAMPRFPETLEEAVQRAADAALRVAKAIPAPPLLIGHAASISGAAHSLTGRTGWIDCALCSLFKLVERDERWETVLWEDVAHLRTR